MKSRKPLKVGFDLDGVILYNPTRAARPIIANFKKIFIKKKINTFYYPKSELEKKFWHVLHKSSNFIAPGYDQIKLMSQDKQIQAYLITARYDHLRQDFENWCQKLESKSVFNKTIYNAGNEQPYIYKRKMIQKHKLDIFVEDNWDIVNYLHKHVSQTKVYWITNFLDRHIQYPHKFNNLKEAIYQIQSELAQQ